MTKWQFREVKKRVPEVVRKASHDGPQVMTPRGDDAVGVVAVDKYARPTRKTNSTLVDFLRQSPLGAVALDLTRCHDTERRHDIAVVTRNTDDLKRCGARCFNPWVGK